MEQFANPRARAQSPPAWEYVLGRIGLTAKGVAWGLVGVLAIGIATGVGGAATSQQGALHALAANTFGAIVLILLAIGFAAYAGWRVLQTVTVHESDAKKAWGRRAGYLASAAVYAAFVYTAAKLVAGSGGGQSQDQRAHHAAAVVLSWPGGPVLVGIAGAALVLTGLWNLYRGVSGTFEEKWRADISASARRWGRRAGAVGHIARFVVFALIGIFVIEAAANYNPNDAVGLDGALQKLSHKSFGPYLLGLTAAGMIGYAPFCLFDAFNRDLTC